MNSSISALRAITSITFRNFLKPATRIIAGIFVVLYGIVMYLGFAASYWWFLALIVLMPITLIVVSLLTAVWYLSKRLMPRPLLPSETKVVEGLVEKVTRLIEARATPVPITMFLIAKDIVRGKSSSYIEGLIADSSTLKSDFKAVTAFFEKKTLS